MKRTAKWMKHLTIAELTHMKEMKVLSLSRFSALRDKQRKMKARMEDQFGSDMAGATEPCFECRHIEHKLREAGVLA